MKNYLINSASIFAGKRFARLYSNNRVSSDKTYKALDTYRALRRMLPIDPANGNHFGNHSGSKFFPWHATQGRKVFIFSSPES